MFRPLVLLKWSAILLGGFALAWLYHHYDPSQYSFFPKCPFKLATGLECPGCGSQRAIHHLLHLEIAQAASYHPLLVLFVPYLLIKAFYEALRNPAAWFQQLYGMLYGTMAIRIIFVLVMVFWIGRNLV